MIIRLHQLKLPLEKADQLDAETLRALAAERLGIAVSAIDDACLARKSIDARDQRDLHWALTVDVKLNQRELSAKACQALMKKFRPNELTVLNGPTREPQSVFSLSLPAYPDGCPRPVVVGAGPAGLFCALALARRGARPILVERGKPVEERAADLDAFLYRGELNENSNALFGEGGAGAFSDGKLTCGLNSPLIGTVLRTLYECGAPEEILVLQRPHIGTDQLRRVIANLRARLLEMGCEIRFQTKLSALRVEDGRVAAAVMQSAEEIATDALYLAIGHSARDTYEMLLASGLRFEQKPFAVGVRIEHRQSDIDLAQYGVRHPLLPPAEYKLHVDTPDGRGVYTFCMCPGGQVMASASEKGGVVTNGMSYHARNGENANAAVLVGVRPEDFGSAHPLAGCAFQRRIEQAAYQAALAAGGKPFDAPCQRVGDFLKTGAPRGASPVMPTYRPGVVETGLDTVLPDFVARDLRYALPLLARRLKGFDAPDALLTAPETRSSSPVRMVRNDRREGSIAGVYPLGEGAGYAGGIVSAALDGLKAGMEER